MSSKGRRGQATCHGDQLIVPVTYCSEPEKYRAVYNILQKYVQNSCWLCIKHIHANRFRFQIRFIIKARNQNWQLGVSLYLDIFYSFRLFLSVTDLMILFCHNLFHFPQLTWLPFIFGYYPMKKLNLLNNPLRFLCKALCMHWKQALLESKLQQNFFYLN